VEYPFNIHAKCRKPGRFVNSLCHPLVAGVAHRLHTKHGKNVVLLGDGCQALRVGGYAHGIVFSAKELKTDELFEVNMWNMLNLNEGKKSANPLVDPLTNNEQYVLSYVNIS